MEKQKRDMNFELLRIVSMILIISSHYIIHSTILDEVEQFSFNYFFIEIIRTLTRISVGLYVLITGYYMIKSKIKIKKLFNTWSIVLFYSIIMLIVSLGVNDEIGIKEIIKSIMPISSGLYWFATTYVALYLLAPFLNLLVNHINKKQYKILIFILTFLLVFQKTIFTGNNYIDARNGESLIWFIFLYLVAGYIRLHFEKKVNKKLCLSITVITPLIITVLRYISMRYLGKNLDRLLFFSNIFNFISLICLFLCFKEIKLNNTMLNKVIGKLAPLTFGIYLIHDNAYFKHFMWNNIFKVGKFANSQYLLLHFLFTVLLIFIICAIVEYGRNKLWKICANTRISKKVDRILDKINNKYWDVMEEKNEN